MKFSRCLPEAGALVLAVVLGFAAGPVLAQAQDRIPPEIVIAQSLTEAQQQQIAGYVAQWAEQLATGDDAQVVLARQRLLEPLGVTGSEAFVKFYSEQLSQHLGQAAASERLIVRLNTMIVTNRMTAATAMPLVEAGLQDTNAAVRYWAAKAVANFTSDGSLPANVQLQLLDQLAARLGAENSVPVVQQLMVSIAGLTVPRAVDQILDALNNRVAIHLKEPGQPMAAEQEGLAELYRKLVSAALDNGAAPGVEQQLRQLARVGARYMDLISLQLESGQVPEEQTESYKAMLLLTDTVLRVAHDTLNSPMLAPSPIENAVRRGEWAFVRVQANQWKNILQASPFNFTPEELALDQAQ